MLRIIINLVYFLSGKKITGGKITVTAKYKFIQVLNEVYDTCYLVDQMGRQCPIPAGALCSSCMFCITSYSAYPSLQVLSMLLAHLKFLLLLSQ